MPLEAEVALRIHREVRLPAPLAPREALPPIDAADLMFDNLAAVQPVLDSADIDQQAKSVPLPGGRVT